MKFVTAWFFSIIILLSTASQANVSCVEIAENSDSTTTVYQQQMQRLQHATIDSDAHSNQSHHNTSNCRDCHFGHCSFTLGSVLYFTSYPIVPTLNFTKKSIVIFDFHTNPFRPPIT